MFLRQCPFCENVNPQNSKFCNACGVRLHAALCPHCGAVNVVTARACVNCAAELVETLHTVVCPECGAVNDVAATACTQCAAELPAPVQTTDARPPVEPAPGKHMSPVTPTAARTEQVARDPPPVTALGEAAPAHAFSVHFDRDHSVKIDRLYDLDTMHLGEHHVAVAAGPAHMRPTAAIPAHESHALAALPSDRFAHSVPPTQLTRAEAAVHDTSSPRRYAALFGVAIFSMLAASAYYLYREHSMAQMSSLVSSSREPKPPDTSGDGASSDQASRGSTSSGRVAAVPVVTAPPVAAMTTPTPPASPAAEPRRQGTGRGQIGSAEAAAAVAAAQARSKTGEAQGERQPQRFGSCTDAIAALGLCTPESSTQRRQ